jgi:hypothetical protein
MLTQERLKELLHYDPETGVFTRLVSVGRRVKVGDVTAKTLNSKGYRRIGIEGTLYQAHRLVWLYTHGCFPPEQMDHINHDRADNRLVNLRCVSNAENRRNAALKRGNTSGFTGVCWQKKRGKWEARVGVMGKTLRLGYFNTKEEAIAARQAANIKYGFHKNHGKAE